ncbi:MAG: FAD-binding oxidoreductase [Pseudomonadota bacterium]
MAHAGWHSTPKQKTYDVVIVGGAIYGSSVAWWLSQMDSFDGSILVIEKDPSYENSGTARTNSCIRQQFTNPLNVQISQFGAAFIRNFRDYMGGDPQVPEITFQTYGYMYLADTEDFADHLRRAQTQQAALGAGTEILSPDQIKARYPFYAVDDLVAGSINTVNEGYWDGGTVFDWWRRGAGRAGVEYVASEVVDMDVSSGAVTSVTLSTGDTITCGAIVNASGTRGAVTARMAGIEIPIEPRKRFTWIFSASEPLDQDLPLTIDPSGVHFRQDGPKTYLAGGYADHDPAVPFDDFAMDHGLWLDKIWPIIATRIPQFEAIKVVTEWAGHYDMNTFDQNAIVGAHPEIANFYFANGFSGHGLQQSPAIGRGLAELIATGRYESLDLTPFGFERIAAGRPFAEGAII